MKTKQDIIPCRLKELRVNNNMSMAQFSEVIGGCLSDSRITLIENGKATLPIQHALQICYVFGCDLNWLYCQDHAESRMPDYLAKYSEHELRLVKDVLDRVLEARERNEL